MKALDILLGCEESQEGAKAWRALGHNAFSCDVLPCSGGRPEWHLQMDVFQAIKLKKWHCGIFFPDCTFLTGAAEWAYKDQPPLKSGKLVGAPRRQARADAYEFFMALWNCEIESIGIENPVGIMSTYFRKPDQIVQPWYFGDDASKKTCIWVKNLPLLTDTNRLPGDTKTRRANQTPSGQNNLGPSTDRAKIRSKSYPGIMNAMAVQYSKYLLDRLQP